MKFKYVIVNRWVYVYEFKNINWICTKDIYEKRFNINNRRYSSLRRLTKQMGLYRASEHHDALADCNMLKDLFNSYMRKNYLEI